MKTTVTDRFQAAIEAFRNASPQRFLVVQNRDPFGWRVLGSFENYDAAYHARANRHPGERGVRVMSEVDWRRRTLERMRTREPWIAIARLNAQLATARADLADRKSIARAATLDAFSEARHP